MLKLLDFVCFVPLFPLAVTVKQGAHIQSTSLERSVCKNVVRTQAPTTSYLLFGTSLFTVPASRRGC